MNGRLCLQFYQLNKIDSHKNSHLPLHSPSWQFYQIGFSVHFVFFFVSDTTTDQIYIQIILHRLKFIGMDVTLVNAQSMLGPGTKNTIGDGGSTAL